MTGGHTCSHTVCLVQSYLFDGEFPNIHLSSSKPQEISPLSRINKELLNKIKHSFNLQSTTVLNEEKTYIECNYYEQFSFYIVTKPLLFFRCTADPNIQFLFLKTL